MTIPRYQRDRDNRGQMDAFIGHARSCERLSALAWHVMAQCVRARGGGGGEKARQDGSHDVEIARVCGVLLEALESGQGTSEIGQASSR